MAMVDDMDTDKDENENGKSLYLLLYSSTFLSEHTPCL